MSFVIAHKTEFLGLALALSEVLSLIPSVKANGIYQLISGALTKTEAKALA